jgi:hypothetical protein
VREEQRCHSPALGADTLTHQRNFAILCAQVEGPDALGNPQIAYFASDSKLCMNDDSVHCTEGNTVFLHQCQLPSKTHVNVANHFVFEQGTLRATFCTATALCVVPPAFHRTFTLCASFPRQQRHHGNVTPSLFAYQKLRHFITRSTTTAGTTTTTTTTTHHLHHHHHDFHFFRLNQHQYVLLLSCNLTKLRVRTRSRTRTPHADALLCRQVWDTPCSQTAARPTLWGGPSFP